MSTAYQELIQNTYLTHLAILPKTKQQHFLSRLYKITGKKPLLKSIQKDAFDYFSDKLLYFQIHHHLEIDFENRFPLQAPIPRQQVRNVFIHSNQVFFRELFIYLDVLMAFNVIHRYKRDHLLPSQLKYEVQSYLDQHFTRFFEELLSNPQYLHNTPVQVINILYWYLHLPNNSLVGTEEARMQASVEQAYQTIDSTNSVLFLNYLYTLTHIIIGQSWFYEYTLNQTQSQWIYSIFDRHIQAIFETKEPDIIAEIGVCYCLQKEANQDIIHTYQEEVSQYVNTSTGYIPSESLPLNSTEDIILSEHRNILAIMLFSGMPTLHPFPTD